METSASGSATTGGVGELGVAGPELGAGGPMGVGGGGGGGGEGENYEPGVLYPTHFCNPSQNDQPDDNAYICFYQDNLQLCAHPHK